VDKSKKKYVIVYLLLNILISGSEFFCPSQFNAHATQLYNLSNFVNQKEKEFKMSSFRGINLIQKIKVPFAIHFKIREHTLSVPGLLYVNENKFSVFLHSTHLTVTSSQIFYEPLTALPSHSIPCRER
jgi:hypothetical protein